MVLFIQVSNSFPECLQVDICLHLNRNLLNNCPAFQRVSAGKDAFFGENVQDLTNSGKSLYFVHALTYCDINKIELSVLKETLYTCPEFAQEFMGKIQDTFNLKRGVLTETQRQTKMDDETLKFIRQKRPHMQSKGRRHVYDADLTTGRSGFRRKARH
ncbi:potassium voltage-gated channel subfamily H member 6-like [Dreissena polymorpha]|uniref:potassium voltage-gated channel subfamily H member 6-like n=1 Tax=Dreissena polymorpha TaxID=45954 RepID=UPI002264E0C5|nr:potassium voltage-gated channel subfamily H member 6-like [Dreissena polymorpha]